MQSLSKNLKKAVIKKPFIKDEENIEAIFSFPPDYPGFSGHFPHKAVLPAVVQIMAGLYTAALGQKTKVKSLGRSKFTRPVVPGEQIRIRAKNKKDGDYIKSSVSMDVDGVSCAVFSLTFYLTP